MSTQQQQHGAKELAFPGRLMRRFAAARGVLVVAVLTFGALVAFFALPLLAALVALAVIAIAVLAREAVRPGAESAAGFTRGAIPELVQRVVATMVAAAPEPMIALTREGLVVAFNASVEQVAPGIMRGEPISFALRAPEVLDALRAVAASGEMRRVEVLQRVPADRWWEASIALLTLPGDLADDEFKLALLTLRDLTPLRRVEEMRAHFVANASHELRTPLAALSGFIETLQGPARNDAATRDRFLAIMKEQATRMARLIEDLLSLSRVEQKAHIHPDMAVDLASIVREVADGLVPLAQERGVAVAIAGQAGSIEVAGDRDELIRVFENLIENALKYGASGKRVDIALESEKATEQSHEALVSVRDYGPGIAPEHLPRLTERFYRVDIGESRAQGGTGLGLALVKHILARHRGRLHIESTPGKGACFTVRLPLAGLQSSKKLS
jgi:two-component system, OmpR family, phosphate regulon sensor histidine kinase PhoR